MRANIKSYTSSSTAERAQSNGKSFPASLTTHEQRSASELNGTSLLMTDESGTDFTGISLNLRKDVFKLQSSNKTLKNTTPAHCLPLQAACSFRDLI